MSEKTLNLIKENTAKWVDLRFTDTRGKEQHVSIRATYVDGDFFSAGKMFDGSSIAGWRGISESDMILIPDADSAVMDPFSAITFQPFCVFSIPVAGDFSKMRAPPCSAVLAEWRT